MRIKRIYPKSKTILPQPPIHVKLYFDPDEMEQIRKQFLLDEGDSITINDAGYRKFYVFINSTRIQKPKTDDVDTIKAANNTVAVYIGDGRIMNIDKEKLNGQEH